MTQELPSCLLYLLVTGIEKELVLQVHGTAPTAEELSEWMRAGSVRPLVVSPHGAAGTEPSPLLINFRHVIGARLAPYSETRTGSF